jgi:hypothetical protein
MLPVPDGPAALGLPDVSCGMAAVPELGGNTWTGGAMDFALLEPLSQLVHAAATAMPSAKALRILKRAPTVSYDATCPPVLLVRRNARGSRRQPLDRS